MTDDEFKRHLYKQMAEDKKNEKILTHRLYPSKQSKDQKQVSYSKSKNK